MYAAHQLAGQQFVQPSTLKRKPNIEETTVEYCNLGRSGLEVSRLGLGTIFFGTALDEKDSQRVFDMYVAAGGNLVDTSNVYGGGMRGTNTNTAGTSERMVGKVVKGKRDKVAIATKGFWLMEDDVTPNSVGLSRTYLTKQVEASLRRLDTDYIDLYQCHCWDFYTPVEETLRVLDDFVRAGKIRYAGVSNWDGWQVVKANCSAQRANLTPYMSNQIYYSLVDRIAENSIIPACRDLGVSIIVWGALAHGFLSGTQKRGAKAPEGSRLSGTVMKRGESTTWEYLATERNWKILDRLERMAKESGRSIPNLVIRWLLQFGRADVVLLGGEKREFYESYLDMLKFRLTDEEVRELARISEPDPSYPTNFQNIFCRRESEFYGGLR
jgi:aryl-alcohol dehydrogenase-like predicted oxidoreductase